MTKQESAGNLLFALLMDAEDAIETDSILEKQYATELRTLAGYLHSFLVDHSCSTPNYDSFILDPVKWIKEHGQ